MKKEKETKPVYLDGGHTYVWPENKDKEIFVFTEFLEEPSFEGVDDDDGSETHKDIVLLRAYAACTDPDDCNLYAVYLSPCAEDDEQRETPYHVDGPRYYYRSGYCVSLDELDYFNHPKADEKSGILKKK